jgi:predicted DCC family thiol-disulfide oxidoreductase YuxK
MTQTHGRAGRAAVIYDGDCGFCTYCVSIARHRLKIVAEFTPWQRFDLAPFGITPERATREVLWLTPDGDVVGGSKAVAMMLRHARRPWPVLGRTLDLPLISWLAHIAYRCVAANRHRFPHGTPACERTGS